MSWTPERVAALEQMWLWGIPSGTIAHNLGNVSRNAVMGRINRKKLIGRGGERLGRQMEGAEIDKAAVAEAVSDLLRGDYDERTPMARRAVVAVSCLLIGHASHVVAAGLGADPATVNADLQAMHDTKVWRRGEPPPAAWWHHGEGQMAFLLDMMTADGMIVLSATDKNGGRSYSLLPENNDGKVA